MARIIVGIDLGSYSVKVVRLEPKGRGGFDVVGYGEALVPPPADGSDALSTLADRHSAALGELKSRGLLEGDVFITGLPGDGAAVRTLSFPFSDAKKIAEALPFALESEIPLDLDEIVLSWAVLGPARTKKDGPVAHTEVLVAWAKKEAVQATLDLLAVHDIDPRYVELNALALDDLYDGLFKEPEAVTREGPSELRTPGGTVIEMGEGAPEPGTAIVDIGHRATNVCVMAGDRVVSAHTILHGGADATRSLAKAIGLPLVEAERGKRKEAFIEVAGAVAQFPEQAQISEVLKNAYAPIVRRLRQIFQASISQARVRVVRVVVVGGGSRVLNLDRHMAEELNVKVARGRELFSVLKDQLPLDTPGEDGAPESALALAYALSGAGAGKARARIDFRTGEFAWRGNFEFVRERAPALATWAAVLVLLLGVSGVARSLVLSSTEDQLGKQEMAMCKEITGKPDIDSFNRCLAMIQERIKGQASFTVPERSAVDTYVEIAQRLPAENEMHRKIEELDINNERVKLRGLTSSFENIDKIVERLQGGKCFSLVEKGKAQNKGTDVEFNITITIDCVAAAVDKPPPPLTGANGAKPAAPAGTSTTAAARPAPAATAIPRPATAPVAVPDRGEEPPAGADVVPRGGKLSPEEIEQRRERLRKLREEREARRAAKLGGDSVPQVPPVRTPPMPPRPFGTFMQNAPKPRVVPHVPQEAQ